MVKYISYVISLGVALFIADPLYAQNRLDAESMSRPIWGIESYAKDLKDINIEIQLQCIEELISHLKVCNYESNLIFQDIKDSIERIRDELIVD